jgi:hypothetical protein
MTVKRHALAVLVSCLFGSAAQAAAIDLDNGIASLPGYRAIDVPTVMRHEAMAPPLASISELPEPEVFAMMLVGLILIGYRASRHSSEKFK